MTRWEPDARGRLEQAALELFEERGFDQATVEDIATRAGVTRRTFFRHFADKREVLFGGGGEFRQRFLDGLADAPASAEPLDAMATALDAVGAFFEGRHERSRRRHRIIAASAELQERELVERAAVATALAAALRARGVAELAERIAAETALVVFRTAFDRWVAAEREERDLSHRIREGFDALRAVTAAR